MTTSASARKNAPAAAAQPTRRRRILVWALVVLATVIAFVAILTIWVDRQMLDNNSWKTASEELIQDPTVQDALSAYLVNQLYDNVDVQQRFAERLPPNLQPLAGPLAGALRSSATNAVGVILARPRVQEAWINASAAAHEKLVNVLENKTGHGISTGSGVVTLDLSQLVAELGKDVGISQSALDKLPPDAGVITIMKSDQLSAAQKGVRTVRALSLWSLVAVLFLYGLAIYLARGFRRETLRNIGFAFVLVGLLVLLARRLLGNYIVDALATPGYQVMSHHAWLIGTSILGQIGRATILYGIVAVLGAVLAGPTSAATATRRSIAPVLNERQGIVWGAVGFAFVLLVLWGGTHALRTWWGILLLGGLLALGVVAFRRQTQREFPAAAVAAAPSAEGAKPLRLRLGGNGASAKSPAEEIARLRELHDTGAISEEEYERGKQLALQ